MIKSILQLCGSPFTGLHQLCIDTYMYKITATRNDDSYDVNDLSMVGQILHALLLYSVCVCVRAFVRACVCVQ